MSFHAFYHVLPRILSLAEPHVGERAELVRKYNLYFENKIKKYLTCLRGCLTMPLKSLY
jgi:hypothetical protein